MLPFGNTIQVVEERKNSQHHSHDVLEAFMTEGEELRVISIVSSVTYWSLHDCQSALSRVNAYSYFPRTTIETIVKFRIPSDSVFTYTVKLREGCLGRCG